MLNVPAEAERLARLVAARSGKTPEDIVRQGVETEARIAGVAIADDARPRKDIDMNRVREIVRDVSSAPLLDGRTADELLDEAWGDPA
jgi:hypothetical protein